MTHVFETILYMSASAGILALLVLGARALFGRRQTVIMSVLFALVIAKLVFPLSIESPASLQNLVKIQDTKILIQNEDDGATTSIAGQTGTSAQAQVDKPDAAPDTIQPTRVETHAQVQTGTYTPPNTPWQPCAMDIAAIVWIAGMVLLGGGIAWSNIRFMRRLTRNRAYSSEQFDAMLQNCQNVFGLKRRISAIQISEINTAAVCGVLRPKLLISPHTFEALSETQQRHVLMHELSHIHRRDTLVCLIIAVLNVVHWFNPILWLTFIIMRKDLEVMCDAKVLKTIGNGERRSYADTLFGLIQGKGTKRMRLVTALFMSRSSIKRRIIMIAKYKKSSPMFIAMALLLTIAIAVTGCTNSVQSVTDKADVIGEYTLDISKIDEEARLSNIEKAVEYFDGIVLEPAIAQRYDPNTVVTEGNGWQEAQSIDWNTFFQMRKDGEQVSLDEYMFDHTVTELGGGFDLVARAVDRAAKAAGIIMEPTNVYDMYQSGVMLINYYRNDVTIRVQTDGNTIKVQIVCADPAKLAIEEVAAIQGMQYELISTHAVDLADYDLTDEDMAQIESHIADFRNTAIYNGYSVGFSITTNIYASENMEALLEDKEYVVMKAMYYAAPEELAPELEITEYGGGNIGGLNLTNSGETVRMWVELKGNHVVASFYKWKAAAEFASYTVDLSGYAHDDKSKHNINKAVTLLNDVQIPPQSEIEVLDYDMIRVKNGWNSATMYSVVANPNGDGTKVFDESTPSHAVGGGYEAAELAIWNGCLLTGLDAKPSSDRKGITITNPANTRVTLHACIDGESLVLTFSAEDPSLFD